MNAQIQTVVGFVIVILPGLSTPTVSAETGRSVIAIHVFIEPTAGDVTSVGAEFSHTLNILNDLYGGLGLKFTLADITTTSLHAALCSGDSSSLGWLELNSPADGLALILARHNATVGEPIGCSIQDGFATGSAFSAVEYPPYSSVLLAGTRTQSQYNRDILVAHEIGHVLGGLHELSLPPIYFAGGTGDIMYPFIEYNMPILSGVWRGGACIEYGNSCRIANLLYGNVADHSARAIALDNS